ncbi:MAG: alpha/beta hydrolase [Microcoleaceae cyanobacterium]
MKLCSCLPQTVWLNTNPSFRHFDQKLLGELAQVNQVAYWEYQQDLDEATTLDDIIDLVHNYLKKFNHPVHLIGHSTGGLIGLLYAQKYPQKVKSLTLLSVGVYPASDWKAHYYIQQQLLPFCREHILQNLARNLFPCQSKNTQKAIYKLLERDLVESFSLHSLYQRISICPASVAVPLMVCGSQTDYVITHYELEEWRTFFYPGDRLRWFPEGGHFFHHFYPEDVKAEIIKFWGTLEPDIKKSQKALMNPSSTC